MATTKNKSESMKNKSNMWGGGKKDAPIKELQKSQKVSASASKTKSTTSKASAKPQAKKTSQAKDEPKAKGGKNMNHKTEFAQDMTQLNDVEIVSDVLTTHKGLVKLYGTALCESSCENLRDLVGRHLTECGEDQFDVFLYMSERNLYPTEDAQAQKVKTAKDKFNGYEKQMKI